MVAERPLLAIDTTLSAFAETRGSRSEEETSQYVAVLARAVLSAAGASLARKEDPVKAMLVNRSCDRIACATMLRLLAVDGDPFEVDPRLRASTVLFDRVLSKSLYREVELKENDQSYVKRDRLRRIVESHEEALIGHVRSLSSLDAMDSFRQWFGKYFGAAGTEAFISPFLPEAITRQTFEELFRPAHDMAECADASLIDRADAVDRRCRELVEEAERVGTRYSEVLLIELARTLQRLAKERVAAAGFLDPAQLSIVLHRKRYPLRHPGTPVTVRLELTNEGPGHAQDIFLEVEGGGAIEYAETTKAIGSLAPGSRQVHLRGTVKTRAGEGASKPLDDVLMIRASWRNPDRSQGQVEEIAKLEEQPGDVPWDTLALEQPYQLEPVTDPSQFVGRVAAVWDLVKVVMQSGNARLEGEKRVGKTSLAYAVSATVEEQKPGRYTFLQLESGDFSSNTPEETVARLGQMIAEGVRRSDPRLAGLPMPDFTPGLTTLTELFAAAAELAPDRAFVIVLDEFDALPHSTLYKHEPVGAAFFQTLRSLGGKRNVGFILVGGERMKWVIAAHGQTLNKFKLVPLDYFPEDQMLDYAELVRAPVAGKLVFSDDAVEALYGVTAGNPWMTKLLLGHVFERQVERRDHEVQAADVEDAVAEKLPRLDSANFQHFWDDAIRGSDEEREHVSATRRRVFLALARCLRSGKGATEDSVVQEALSFNVDEGTAREVLRDLLERSIIRHDDVGLLTCRLPLFERWLVRYGAQKIILGSGDDDTLIRKQRSIEEMRPSYDELCDLAKRWRSYQGEDMHPDRIAAWLEQFGGPEEQRHLMPILEGLRFYTRPAIDENLRNLHLFVLRELALKGYEYEFTGQQRNRDDLLVCGLEGGGSGAAHLLKRYRDENGIYSDCAVDASRVRAALDAGDGRVRAVLVLDDFVGTGGTATRRLKELHRIWTADAEWPNEVDVFLLVVSGFDRGAARIERATTSLFGSLVVRLEDTFDDQDRCFHDESRLFPDVNAREQAKALCARFGASLSPRTPLGFGNGEAAVCFEYRCPNNTLPVLWNGSADWQPLFPRH